MHLRVAFTFILLAASSLPAFAQSALAPADEYFGRYRLSVLGINNLIRDAGARAHDPDAAASMIGGPLAFATDGLRDWESKYPADTWIPRMLYALEIDYLNIGTPESLALAGKTGAWLSHDYPNSPSAVDGRLALNQAGIGPAPDAPPNRVSAWERFAALRAPLAPPR